MIMKEFNRRDFLKLASLFPAAYYLKPDLSPQAQDPSQPNIIILVFDAWSASNISLYGYPRKTTPFLEKLAEKAIVYHNHYAGGHWTYPGTASLLTGVLPWKHRGYSISSPILNEYHKNNLFGLFNSYHRVAYTHNQITDAVLQKMIGSINYHKPRQELYVNDDFWLARVFGTDYDNASTAWVRVSKKFDDGYANSLFLSRIYDLVHNQAEKKIRADYPLGLPAVEGDNYFYIETAIDWIYSQATTLPHPFLGYFHLLPPHDPYRTRNDFYGNFRHDGYQPTPKPEHLFTQDLKTNWLNERRREYDEFILLVDSEINRLYNMLEENNALDNTWLVITSDHGEMFERGIVGHLTPTMHNPQMHVPLVILPPGQEERQDITTPTVATDLIPTLLHLSGKSAPNWLEGTLLPPFNTAPDSNRPIFGMDARFSDTNTGPFTNATLMLLQNDYKLTYFFGNRKLYEVLNGQELFELYDLKNDPEELENLYNQEPTIAQIMLNAIYAKMEEYSVR